MSGSDSASVSVQAISKAYSLFDSPAGRLRHMFFGQDTNRMFWALQNVSFEVQRGETFGIIGVNGSGKSTLLQIISGILQPTSGEVKVNGRLAALLELGSGFNPEFTGRENVYMNAAILGMSKAETSDRLPAIERFAGIGEFLDQPVRNYSSGMVLRLAFAVSAHVDPEILIVDEALAVGDIAFRQRCMRRVHELQASGTTILFVSHDSGDVRALCERCLWLHKGKVEDIGPARKVIAKYLAATFHGDVPAELQGELDSGRLPGIGGGGHRYGNGRAVISSAKLSSLTGNRVQILQPEMAVVLRVGIRAILDIERPIVGFLVRNSKGEIIFGTNTARENVKVPKMQAGEEHSFEFQWKSPTIAAGRYMVSLGVSDGTVGSFEVCDYVEEALEVTIAGDMQEMRGYLRLKCSSVKVRESSGHSA